MAAANSYGREGVNRGVALNGGEGSISMEVEGGGQATSASRERMATRGGVNGMTMAAAL